MIKINSKPIKTISNQGNMSKIESYILMKGIDDPNAALIMNQYILVDLDWEEKQRYKVVKTFKDKKLVNNFFVIKLSTLNMVLEPFKSIIHENND